MDFNASTATIQQQQQQNHHYHTLLLRAVIDCNHNEALRIKREHNIDVNAPIFLWSADAQPMPLLHAYLHCVDDYTDHSRGINILKNLSVDANQVITINGKRRTPLLIAIEKTCNDIFNAVIDELNPDISQQATIVSCLKVLIKKARLFDLEAFIKKCKHHIQAVETNAGFLLYYLFSFETKLFHNAAQISQILIDECKQDPYFLPNDGRPPILHVAISYCIEQTFVFMLPEEIADILQTLLDGGANPLAYRSQQVGGSEIIIHPSALDFYLLKTTATTRSTRSTKNNFIVKLLTEGEIKFRQHPEHQRAMAIAMAGHRRLGAASHLRSIDPSILHMIAKGASSEQRHIVAEARTARFDAALLRYRFLRPDQLTPQQSTRRELYINGDYRTFDLNQDFR